MDQQSMIVKRVRVKVHRSSRAYNHDEVEFDAEVTDGADPDAVVANLQRRGDDCIARHWREKDEAEKRREEEERQRRAAVRAAAVEKRDAYARDCLAKDIAPAQVCANCEVYDGPTGCDDCPIRVAERAPDPAADPAEDCDENDEEPNTDW